MERDEYAGKLGLEGPYQEYLKYLQDEMGQSEPKRAEVKTPEKYYADVEGSGGRFKPEDFEKMLKYMLMAIGSDERLEPLSDYERVMVGGGAPDPRYPGEFEQQVQSLQGPQSAPPYPGGRGYPGGSSF